MNEPILDEEKDSDYCTCGHMYNDHFLDPDGQIIDEGAGCCLHCYYMNCACDVFKLDNFAFVLKAHEKRQIKQA